MSKKGKSKTNIVSTMFDVTRATRTLIYVATGNVSGLVKHGANKLIGSKITSRGFL